jgi:hypothetical protein
MSPNITATRMATPMPILALVDRPLEELDEDGVDVPVTSGSLVVVAVEDTDMVPVVAVEPAEVVVASSVLDPEMLK